VAFLRKSTLECSFQANFAAFTKSGLPHLNILASLSRRVFVQNLHVTVLTAGVVCRLARSALITPSKVVRGGTLRSHECMPPFQHPTSWKIDYELWQPGRCALHNEATPRASAAMQVARVIRLHAARTDFQKFRQTRSREAAELSERANTKLGLRRMLVLGLPS
jgi:hypothetical protein